MKPYRVTIQRTKRERCALTIWAHNSKVAKGVALIAASKRDYALEHEEYEVTRVEELEEEG